MADFRITKGKNLKIKGHADKDIKELPFPREVAVQPQDFRNTRVRVVVKEGDKVKAGTVLFYDKAREDVVFLSPVSGTVKAVNRGAKRALLEVVVATDDAKEQESFASFSSEEISKLSIEDVKKALLKGGMWPALRQRPFSNIADQTIQPKSIFVKAINTDPLAIDVDYVMQGQEETFQAGIDALKVLSKGDVHVCTEPDAESKALTDVKNATTHTFAGPHPAGNVSVHIYKVDKIEKGDFVWYVDAQEVARIGELLLTGSFPAKKIYAVTGEGASSRYYAKTIVGTPLSDFMPAAELEGKRCLSGSALSGHEVGAKGFVGFYDSQITILPEGGHRKFLGWLIPGFDTYTLTNTYASAFAPKAEYSLDTDTNGGERAIVLNHLYDKYLPLDIPVYFLLKAVLANDIDSAEKMGILEVDEEDFALCTFVCPSKVEIGRIIRNGLDAIQKEG